MDGLTICSLWPSPSTDTCAPVIQFECFFGYLVNTNGRAVDSLAFQDIQDVDLLRDYAYWHAETRANGASRFIEKTLGDFLTFARHYLEADQQTLAQMAALKSEMKAYQVRDRREQWVSLATMEAIGQAEYPDGQPRPNGVYRALAAQRSLMIRLMVRRPMRNRNFREMQLGRNLYREANGWMIDFQGEELKVERRGSQPNVYRISFPPDLEESLEEYLEVWRPVLNKKSSNCVFLTRRGDPVSQNALNAQVQKTIYAYTGRATNVHLIRHIWATECIERTQNFNVVAAVLGDTLETVLRHYAHLRTHNAGQHANKFPIEILGN